MIDEAPQQNIAFTYDSFLGLPATTPYPVETLSPQVYDLIQKVFSSWLISHKP